MQIVKFTDQFTRADANPIAGTWSTVATQEAIQLSGNSVRNSGTIGQAAAYESTGLSADQWAQVTITAASEAEGGVILRCSASARTYYGVRASTNAGVQYQIYKRVAGAYTDLLGPLTGSIEVGDRVVGTVEGYRISMYKNGALVATVVDAGASIASGFAGMEIGAVVATAGWQMDDFLSGDVAPRLQRGLSLSSLAEEDDGRFDDLDVKNWFRRMLPA